MMYISMEHDYLFQGNKRYVLGTWAFVLRDQSLSLLLSGNLAKTLREQLNLFMTNKGEDVK